MEEITQGLQTWGYMLLFLYSLGGGYMGLVAAATMSTLDQLDITLCILVAFLANMLGSTFLAYIARYYKTDILPMFAKYSRQIALTQIWIRKYGKISIFIGKYIQLIRAIVPVAVGISRYKFSLFLLYNAIASLVWAVLIGCVTFFSSNAVLALMHKLDVHPYILPAVLICWGIFIAFLIHNASRKIHKKPKSTRA
ncbi:DedA family protein [Helicobacter sp. TUL]|uniref:DedA family protein n=1 Tax=Helicobacter sp. TUL TaxID=1848928 RepID=UPI000BAB58C4|nr:DedA family protein [Helicobacter sp. TUL]PAV00710.1 hypothetical protein B9T66_01695 [Helicobacter sp. TUL]